MRSFRLILPAALAMALVACGEDPPPTLTLTALPASIEVLTGSVQLEVRGQEDGRSLLETTEITLSTDLGSFIDGQTEQVTSVPISGGKAVARLYSPRAPGTATVQARYVNPYGVEVKATATVKFTLPRVVRLNFSCSARNIGAFVTGEDMAVRCDATPEDEMGAAVRHASVRFLTEAGEFTSLESDDPENKRVLFTYNPHTGGREPKDVEPEGDEINGEPRWTDPAFSNRVRNPRDGLATLVAYVETPTDGLQGEPYVDANDNDQYDSGEEYKDLNGNGRYDDVQETHLWKMIKILWTGESWGFPASKVEALDNNFNIERGATKTLNFTILDRNLNVLAANGIENVIAWSAKEGSVTVVGADEVQFGRVDPWGMDIDSSFRLRNRTRRDSYTRSAVYSVTIRNDNTDTEGDPPTPVSQPYQFSGEVSHKAATDSEASPSNDISGGIDATAVGILY